MPTPTEQNTKDTTRHLSDSIEPKRIYPIDDTTAVTGLNGYAIQAITDTTIASITTLNVDPGAPWNLTAQVISAGTIIYVKISAITLTSGACIIYEYN